MSADDRPATAPALLHGGREASAEDSLPVEVVAGAGGTTNVTALRVARHEPTASAVSTLESMLKAAKAGEYNAVMVVATDWEGCVTDACAMAAGSAKYPLIGGMHCALQKFVDKAIE